MGDDERVRALGLLREVASTCTRCSLSASRTTVVFGEGSPRAPLVVVGEAPGADEDADGRPFIGDAGRTLDELLADTGLSRADAYVANTVMCRPPANRPPTEAEVAACAPYLALQLAVVRPRVVLALGATATRRLTGARTLAEARQRPHATDGDAVVIPTYHPSLSGLNRDPDRRSLVREDLRRVGRLLGDAAATR